MSETMGWEINCELSLWHVWWFELQLGRTAKLISRLKAHLERAGLSQVTLSKELGISPAALSEVMRGRNSPNSETTLHIIEIIEPQTMRTIVDPPAMPRQAAGNPGPKTLTEARERIEVLEAQVLQLGGAPAPTATGTPKPAAPAIRTAKPAPALKPTATAMEREIERARQARMEGLSSKPPAQQTVRELQAALNNAKPEDRDEIYRELKTRQGDTALASYRKTRQR